MKRADVGIIGGTGLGEALSDLAAGEPVTLDTPFGPPSGPITLAQWEGIRVAFLSRHGPGHTLGPSRVPYRANIWALKKLGVSSIIAGGATGSLQEHIEPGHMVICDQVIDKTHGRASTFFCDEGVVVHVAMADPFCPRLRSLLGSVADQVVASTDGAMVVHNGGTYVCMDGPQFSTRAEAHMHRSWGGDLVGMTCMPEAKLAREAEICYALIGLPTDYDCWRPPPPGKDDDLLAEIIANLQRATAGATAMIRAALSAMSGKGALADAPSCGCGTALDLAVWTDRSLIGPQTCERLGPVLERFLGGPEAQAS